METFDSQQNGKEMTVLLIGNNPMEMQRLFDGIKQFKNPLFRIYIAFGFRRIFKTIKKFRPTSILIDDRLNPKKLNRLIKRIHRNPKTCDIPVTVLKSVNKDLEMDAEADDYVMKENLTPENLYHTIVNSRRLRRTSVYLYNRYKKSRGLLQKIWLDIGHNY